MVIKKKALKAILPTSSSWRIANTAKPALKSKLQGFIHDSGFSGTRHSQIIHVFVKKEIDVLLTVSLNYISCLDCLSKSLSNRLDGCCCFLACRTAEVLKIPRVSNSLKDYGVQEVNCKRKWFRQTTTLSETKFSSNSTPRDTVWTKCLYGASVNSFSPNFFLPYFFCNSWLN